MQYFGFVLEYKYGKSHPDQSFHFDGPYSTIEEAQSKFDELSTLTPCVEEVRICRLVANAFNPKLY